jgi:hypothetical protein
MSLERGLFDFGGKKSKVRFDSKGEYITNESCIKNDIPGKVITP